MEMNSNLGESGVRNGCKRIKTKGLKKMAAQIRERGERKERKK